MRRGMRAAVLVVAATALAGCATKEGRRGGEAEAVSGASGPAETAAPEAAAIVEELVPIEGAKVLVVYFSQGAATARVARDLAALSGADLEQILEEKSRTMNFFGFMNAGRQATFGDASKILPPKYDPSAYDAVVVLTPVWSWNVAPPVRAWLRLMKGKLPARLALGTVSGDTEPDKIVARMEKEADAKARSFAGFGEKDFLPENRAGYVAKVGKLAEGLR